MDGTKKIMSQERIALVAEYIPGDGLHFRLIKGPSDIGIDSHVASMIIQLLSEIESPLEKIAELEQAIDGFWERDRKESSR